MKLNTWVTVVLNHCRFPFNLLSGFIESTVCLLPQLCGLALSQMNCELIHSLIVDHSPLMRDLS